MLTAYPIVLSANSSQDTRVMLERLSNQEGREWVFLHKAVTVHLQV